MNKHPRVVAIVVVGTILLVACGRTPPAAQTAASLPDMPPAPADLAGWARGAQLFDGLGSFHRKITTKSAAAQSYFDQGMRLLWGFNHDESTRSFARAAELDPDCASCLWGVSLTVGPNYNQPLMAEARAKVAWATLQQAMKLRAHSSPVEQALIGALGKRYSGPVALDPSNEAPLLAAYADAMREVAKRFPRDFDVQTLFAESLMNLNAWKLWSRDGKPAQGTEEIVATLKSVLERDPTHPGANHYYIHALEASPHPAEAVAAAERLGSMMPAAGHLVHMPAHILQRVGRYEEAAEANRKAAAADAAYLAKTTPLDYYPMYVGHNYQFLAYSAAMEGRKAETLDAVRHFREAIPESLMLMMPGLDWYGTEEYLALVRFGLWDELLAAPAPNPKLQALCGGYLFARTLALAAKGRAAEARVALAELERLGKDVAADAPAALNSAKAVLGVAAAIARAKVAASEGQSDDALRGLADAVTQEDALAYDEPADWFFPVRHLLGAELLRAGKAAEAERVYREDLRRNAGNGWSLFGLAQALKAQGKDGESRKVDAQFRDAWQHADVTLTASAM